MLLFFSQSALSADLVRALCRTLVHSLWQGLLLVLLVSAVLFFTRKRRAALRYNLLAVSLGLFLVGVGYTLWIQVQGLRTSTHLDLVAPFSESVIVQAPAEAGVLPAIFPAKDWIDTISAALDAYSVEIVTLWWLVFAFKGLRMAAGLRALRGLRRYDTQPAEPEWQQRLRVLADKLRLRQPVLLLESARVRVPAAMGILKPVILVPLGMLAQLPATQVEAVLLHELAHIRRRDFLVNLLQHLAETVFFFNPAVLWVSELLRTEREHCCDDLALAALNSTSGYLNALLYFEQLQAPAGAYAPAFPGREGQLLHRVRRILGQHDTKIFSNMEKITLITSAFVATALALLPLAGAQAQVQQHTPKASFSSVQVTGDDTAASPEYMTILGNDGKTYQVKRVAHKVQDLTVDGQQVPADQYDTYAPLIAAVDEQISRDREQARLDKLQAERDAAQAREDKLQAEHDAEQAQADQSEAEREAIQAKRDAEQAELDAEQAKRDEDQAKLDAEQAKRDEDQAKLDAEQAKRDAEQAKLDAQQAKRDAEQARLQAKRDREQALLDAEQAKRDAQQAKRDAEQAKRDAVQAKRDAEQAKKDKELVDNLIGDIVGDKLVASKADLKSFRLTAEVFEVNGQRQPAAIHQKYRAKYQKNPGFDIYYGMDGDKKSGIFIGSRSN